jgi:hypothetical protein
MNELPNPFKNIIFKKEDLGELSVEAQKRHEEFMMRWDKVTRFHSSEDLFL